MSYILEALRKADAERERERGAVPDLHAQPFGNIGAGPDIEPRPRRPWLWLAAGAAIPLAALLAWQLGTPDAAPRVAALAPARQPEPSAPPPPAPAPSPVPQRPAPPATAATPLMSEPAAPPPPRPTPRAPAPTRKADAATPPARVATLNELPEDLRRLVPAMAIGGSVYSPEAESRMLVVNGQVVREGSALTPDLKLEQIGRNSAVFSIRGQRFAVSL